MPVPKNLICAVCGAILSQDNRYEDINAFHPTCQAHNQYATIYRLHQVKQRLGLAIPLLNESCVACRQPLTQDESIALPENHFHPTCKKHRHLGTYYSLLSIRFHLANTEGKKPGELQHLNLNTPTL